MSVIITVIACLLGGLVAGVVSARVFDVLSAGKTIAVGVVTGITLAAVCILLVGVAGAVAALVGGVAGSIAYGMLIASALGGC